MLTLAAAQSGEAVQWFVLGAACFASARLLVQPPVRRIPESEPHRVPGLAVLLATLWLSSLIVPGVIDAIQGETPQELPTDFSHLSPMLLVMAGLQSILTTAVMYLAIEIPRLARSDTSMASPAPAEPPQPVTLEIASEAGSSPTVSESPATDSPAEDQGPRLPPRWRRDLVTGIQLGLAAILLTTLAGMFMQLFRTRDELHPYLELLIESRSWTTLLLVSTTAVIIAPLKEELIFRVILQGWLTDRTGQFAIVMTAILFASVHSPQDAPLLVPLALMLGLLYDRQRSYLSVVAAHATFNAANILMAVALG